MLTQSKHPQHIVIALSRCGMTARFRALEAPWYSPRLGRLGVKNDTNAVASSALNLTMPGDSSKPSVFAKLHYRWSQYAGGLNQFGFLMIHCDAGNVLIFVRLNALPLFIAVDGLESHRFISPFFILFPFNTMTTPHLPCSVTCANPLEHLPTPVAVSAQAVTPNASREVTAQIEVQEQPGKAKIKPVFTTKYDACRIAVYANQRKSDATTQYKFTLSRSAHVAGQFKTCYSFRQRDVEAIKVLVDQAAAYIAQQGVVLAAGDAAMEVEEQ